MNADKKSFMLLCSLTLIFTLLFTVIFIGIARSGRFQNADELLYEECTFIRYERGANRDIYNVYTEEYDAPLEIDNIVFDKIDVDVLSGLDAGDMITISKYEKNGNLTLYSISYQNKYILSYDNYLECHNRNHRIGMIFFPIMIVILIAFLIWQIVYYKRYGKALPI